MQEIETELETSAENLSAQAAEHIHSSVIFLYKRATTHNIHVHIEHLLNFFLIFVGIDFDVRSFTDCREFLEKSGQTTEVRSGSGRMCTSLSGI